MKKSSISHYIEKYPRLKPVWSYVVAHPQFIDEIKDEIDRAIELFNKYRKGEEIGQFRITLKSAAHLKEVIHNDLPSVYELLKIIDTHPESNIVLDEIFQLINQFEFIDTLKPVKNCAAVLLLGAYRSSMLILFPYLKEGDVQISSSLEEMIALLAIGGNKTQIFESTKQWYQDYQSEGFSRDLSIAVEKI